MAKRTKNGRKVSKRSFVGLEQLFGSRTRFKLLKIFCQNQDKKFFVRELARLTDNQLNAVRREVSNLEQLEIIEEIVANNTKKKFFKLNSDFVLFNEINALILRSELLIEKKLIDSIKGLGNIDLCILTGSLVGDEEASCDIMLVGKIKKSILAKTIEEFEAEVKRPVIYTIFTPEEYKYRKSLTDRFLFSLLEGKKIVAVDKRGEFAEED
tara:strand:+ start:1082 stop:1714 length:633 start_codon:yes stop_codon:yes gene_type:complete